MNLTGSKSKTNSPLVWTQRLFSQNSPESTLLEAMKYGVLSSKTIPPILGMCSFEAKVPSDFKEKNSNHSFALECIHAFTLIHDDLPAMDNDELRRENQPSGNSLRSRTILAGNALVGEAFWILFWNRTTRKTQKLFPLVSHTLRVQGVNGGQARDILLENRQNTPEDTEETHRKNRCSYPLFCSARRDIGKCFSRTRTVSSAICRFARTCVSDSWWYSRCRRKRQKHSEKPPEKMSLQRICSNIWIGTSEERLQKR